MYKTQFFLKSINWEKIEKRKLSNDSLIAWENRIFIGSLNDFYLNDFFFILLLDLTPHPLRSCYEWAASNIRWRVSIQQTRFSLYKQQKNTRKMSWANEITSSRGRKKKEKENHWYQEITLCQTGKYWCFLETKIPSRILTLIPGDIIGRRKDYQT